MTVHLPDLFAKLSAYRFAAKIMCNGFIEVCNRCTHFWVVPYIGTWIETVLPINTHSSPAVVPYIGTWIET